MPQIELLVYPCPYCGEHLFPGSQGHMCVGSMEDVEEQLSYEEDDTSTDARLQQVIKDIMGEQYA